MEEVPRTEDLMRALARLPWMERQAYLLATRERLSVREIAARLATSAAHAQRLVTRASATLDRDLNEDRDARGG